VGVPHSLMNFLASISFIFYNRMMIGLNPMILTAFTLYSRLEQIALIPVWSLSSALSSVAGQAAGAKDLPRMRAATKTATLLGIAVSGTLYVAFVIASRALFEAFQSDPLVLDLATAIVPWMAIGSLVSLPIFMIMTVMTTAGFANSSLILTAIRIYALSVPACAIGVYWVGRTLHSAMIGLVIASILSLFLALAWQSRFFRGLESGRLTIRISAE